MGPPRTPQKALIHRPVPKVYSLAFDGPTGLIVCLSLQYVERIHSKERGHKSPRHQETSSVTVSIHRHPDTSYRRMGPRSLKLTQLARVWNLLSTGGTTGPGAGWGK